MYSNEEEKLDDYMKKLEQIDIPEGALDKAIEAGLRKAKNEETRRFHRKWLMSAAMIAVVLLGFFTSIRISPAFADYIAEIPGMEKIVELIRHDKGVMTAIENQYYQEIGVSEKKNGLEVVIDGAIADENGMILFYTLNAPKKQESMSIEQAHLQAKDDGHMNVGSISYGSPHLVENGEKSFSGTLEYFFQEPLTAKEFQLDLEVHGDTLREEFSIPFTLTEDMKAKKIYELNETVEIEGQKIHFKTATVYPLRVAIHVKMDPENTKKLLEFEDLRLVDEHGEAWSKISNGTTASRISDDETIYYLQSNYFKETEKLFLAFSKVQAVDKEYSAVVVDTDKKKILSQPPGNKLRDLEIKGRDITFSLYTEAEFHYGLFSEVIDGEGNKIDIDSSFWTGYGEDGSREQVGVSIPNLQSYPNPIRLEFAFFPEWIVGETKIRIK